MTKSTLALSLLLVLTASAAAFGQSSPFDMTGEQSASPPAAVAPPLPAAPAAPAVAYPAPLQLEAPAAAAPSGGASAIPTMVPSLDAGRGAPRNVAPAVQAIPPPVAVQAMPSLPAAAADSAAPASATAAPAGHIRYIIPQPSLRLAGETDQRAWNIFLTTGEAARAARISVSYKNAIVVMPEASRLRIVVNGQIALETSLASSDDFKSVTADIPADMLQPGENLVRFEAVQRHRTDCSIQSTYELWTDIDPAGTNIDFGSEGGAVGPATLEELPAVGYDAAGRTTIHLVTPRANESALSLSFYKLAQAIALYGQYPNPSVVATDRSPETGGPGVLTLMVAPAAELSGVAKQAPGASAQPTVSFLPGGSADAAALIVTGSDWGQVQAAIDAVASRIDRPLDVGRSTLGTAYWFAPNVHFFTGAESVALSDMGVATQQFSGRRFRVEFGIGIPSDFYAQSYGEATLLLDAAYTPAVLPASHIDVYVNGQIAATTRIVNKTGGIFRHFPINIPFRNFHPGVNRITLEAVLDTADDRACGPGGAMAGPDRFVLFDTSEFSMPTFARIARRPDLAAFGATAAPYNRQTAPSVLVVSRTNASTVGATSTLLARLAIQAGRIVPLSLASMANIGDRPAIFVGSAAQLSPELLRRLGISDGIRTSWKPDALLGARGAKATEAAVDAGATVERQNTGVLFNQWRDRLSDGGGWRGQVSGIEDWLKRTFDISFSNLRLGPAAQVAFEPRAKASLLLAQGAGSGDVSSWTLLTAPSDEQLASATRSLVAIETWSGIGGQFSTYSAATGKVDNQDPKQFTFIPSQPFSLQNARLIAANWMSSNITFYAIVLIASCLLLGVVTSGLMHRLGRPS